MVEAVLGMTDLQIKLFTAVGQILIAGAVGVVAWRQWRTAQQQAETARKKLRLDLFERRIRAFDQLKKLLNATSEPHPDDADNAFEQLFLISGPTGEIRWLFGPEVQLRFRDEVFEKFSAWRTAGTAVAKGTSDEERKSLIAARDAALDEVLEAWARFPEIFAPSLTLLD